MNDNKQQRNDQKKGVNPVVTGVAGAVIGAGAAVAATVAMKDDKTKKKVQEVMKIVGNKAGEYIDSLKTEAKSQLAQKSKETTKKVVSQVKKYTK